MMTGVTSEAGGRMELRVNVHRGEDGMYWAEVHDLPGAFASGETIPELVEAVEEAVSLYLAEPDQPLPDVQVTSFGIAVPDAERHPQLQPS